MNTAKWLTLLGSALLAVSASAQPALQTLVTNGLSEPYGVAVDPNNNFYISDSSNNRIAKYNPDTGALTNYAGFPAAGGLQNGRALFARFFNPQGIVYTRGGIAVADSGNHQIRFISAAGDVTTIAGGAKGFADGPGATAQFNGPAGLAADAAGNIFVADLVNGRIRRIAPDNVVSTVASGLSRPSAVTIDRNTDTLYVAESGSHSISSISPSGAITLIAGSGTSFISGYRDHLIGTDALFNAPRGLVWVGGTTGLLVSDTGNAAVRKIYFNPALNSYSVETYVSTDELISPIGLAVDRNGNIPLVDLGREALLSIQVTKPQAPVTNPVIGFVYLTTNAFGQMVTALSPVVSSTFNNDVKVAILGEDGTETFYNTDGNLAFPDDPTTRSTPPPYANGLPSWTHTLIDPAVDGPDTTIRAFSAQDGRKPSQVVTARFQFKAANPVINGKNPAGFSLENSTEGAQMWYTTDGSAPTNSSPAQLYVPGTRLNIVDGTNDVVFTVRAFKPGYQPSSVVTRTFLYRDLQTSLIGVTRDFEAGIGSTVVVPVEVKLAPGDEVRSLQFRVELTPNTGAPQISMQFRNLPIGTNDFVAIPRPSTNAPNATTYVDGDVTGLAISYIGSSTGLEITDSAVVALLAIPVPRTATVGQTYTISVTQPSATSDGFQTPILLTTFRNRTLTVTNISYVVGDSAVGAWYNAGDFGNGNLNNNDVNNAFHASLGLNTPFAFTDVFDAMDSFPEDSQGSVGGDGQIRFLDWQITLQRSLRLAQNNWRRTWTAGGIRTASSATLNGAANTVATELVSNSRIWVRQADVSAGSLENVAPGATVSVPVYVNVSEGSKLAGLQFRTVVEPEGDAPALNQPAEFVGASSLPTPITLRGQQERLPINHAIGAWSIVQGGFQKALQSRVLVGHVHFTVPAAAKAGQNYVVRFLNPDGAPDLQTQYDLESHPGFVWIGTVAQRIADKVSDEWKLRFFGSIRNPLSGDNADPDGDGVPNWIEYRDGKNPAKLRLHQVLSQNQGFKLRWFAEPNKKYSVESSADLFNWSQLQDVIGAGNIEEITDGQAVGGMLFYRISTQP